MRQWLANVDPDQVVDPDWPATETRGGLVGVPLSLAPSIGSLVSVVAARGLPPEEHVRSYVPWITYAP